MKDNGCLYSFLGMILILILVFINFQYPFMHFVVLGGVLLVVLFFVIMGIGILYQYIQEKIIINKVEQIKKLYPNGYYTYLHDYNIRNNLQKIIESEKEIAVYEKNFPLVSLWDKWGKEQSNFSKSCRNLFQSGSGYGYYHYQFSTQNLHYSGEYRTAWHPLWHFFIYAYSSHIKSDSFEKKYFNFILNNNKDVDNITKYKHALSSSTISSLVKLIDIFTQQYPQLKIILLLPKELDKNYFFNNFYKPIKEALPNNNLLIEEEYHIESKIIINTNIIVLDIYTSEERQIKISESFVSSCGHDAPNIIYLSVYKEYSEKELNAILKEKRDLIEKKDLIRTIIDQGFDHIKEAKLELAGEEFKEAKKEIENAKLEPQEIKELEEHLEETREKAATSYSNIETFESWNEEIIVDYVNPIISLQSDNCYVVTKFPQKGCHVYPYRRGKKSYLVGFSEGGFFNTLSSLLPNNLVEVKRDVFLAISSNRVIEPDLAVIIPNKPSIKIDIEIDEPYEIGTKKPIHYISCGDAARDNELTRRGWIVVRFAEKQVVLYPDKCAGYIANLIKSIFPDFDIPQNLLSVGELPTIKRWTQNEALLMAAKKEREEYLNHEFNNEQEKKNTYVNFVLNENEIQCNDFTEKNEDDLEFANKINSFTEAERFERDKTIGFNAYEHIYINKHNDEHFLPVSSLISYFFEGFNAIKQAEIQWERYHIPIEESLYKWDRIGKQASEVGTFLHLQAESYLKNGAFELSYNFNYDGNTEIVSIEKEFQYFQKFVKDYKIKPYRQEWPIFDEELNIAGTIDLICQIDNNTFVIYDWKRSGKVVNSQGHPNIEAYGGKTGFNGVNLPDTSFFHYCIQQNLYRYILEKNYGIKVQELNLVVLWPEYSTYYKVNIPFMDDIINHIVNICIERDLGHCLLT